MAKKKAASDPTAAAAEANKLLDALTAEAFPNITAQASFNRKFDSLVSGKAILKSGPEMRATVVRAAVARLLAIEKRMSDFWSGPNPPGAAEAARSAQWNEIVNSARVLETTAAASDEEVAKAYRRLLQRHHPDKLKANGLPESMLAHAKQRTQQIIEAWELVREQRGIR